jgi:ribosomal protein S18 acetylase RimI-like enzyme
MEGNNDIWTENTSKLFIDIGKYCVPEREKLNITIKNFSLDYYKEIISLWKESPGVGLSSADDFDNLKLYIEKNRKYSYLAFLNEKVIGTILAGHDNRRAYIYHFVVDSKYRNLGVGKKLFTKSINELQNEGVKKCHIAVYKSNKSAKTIWKKIGFKLRTDLDMMSFEL